MFHVEQNSTTCPSCLSPNCSLHARVKDHFLTQEEFALLQCQSCNLVFTSPRPELSVIGDYYKSENYVSHSSTKKGLVNRVYTLVRDYTLKQKIAWIKSIHPSVSVHLDVGAGTGHFVQAAKKAGFNSIGLEPDKDARAFASNVLGVQLDPIHRLHELENSSIDVITMWHVLEHVYDLNADLNKLVSLLKPGGCFFIAVPNYTSYDAEFYGSDWAAYDVPRHLYHFSEEVVKNKISGLGLNYVKTIPMKFDAFYVSMLSEKYKGSNSLLNAFKIGWKSNRLGKKRGFSSQVYVFKKGSV